MDFIKTFRNHGSAKQKKINMLRVEASGINVWYFG